MKRALYKVATLALLVLTAHQWIFAQYHWWWWEIILVVPVFAVLVWMSVYILGRA